MEYNVSLGLTAIHLVLERNRTFEWITDYPKTDVRLVPNKYAYVYGTVVGSATVTRVLTGHEKMLPLILADFVGLERCEVVEQNGITVQECSEPTLPEGK